MIDRTPAVKVDVQHGYTSVWIDWVNGLRLPLGSRPIEEDAIRDAIAFGEQVKRQAAGMLAELHRKQLYERMTGCQPKLRDCTVCGNDPEYVESCTRYGTTGKEPAE